MVAEFTQTQIIVDACAKAIAQYYDSLTPEQINARNAILAFKDSAKTVGKAEGMKPGDVVTSSDGSLVLECKNAPGARITKASLMDLGKLGETVVGLFNEAHANDVRGSQFALMDSAAHLVEIEEICKFIEAAKRCKQAAEEYKAAHPEEFPEEVSQ